MFDVLLELWHPLNNKQAHNKQKYSLLFIFLITPISSPEYLLDKNRQKPNN